MENIQNQIPNNANDQERESLQNFFTGLSDRKGTRPGFQRGNENFKIKFEYVQCESQSDQTNRFVKDRFESCYNWEPVIDIILECLEYYYDDGDFQIDLQHSVRAWLSEFGGWGLLFTLLPMDFQKFLIVLFSHVKLIPDSAQKSNEELFEDMVELYRSETQGMPLSDLAPKIDAKLLNIIGGRWENERTKLLKIKFLSTRFTLIVNFTVEKKRLRRTLLEHAAEVVGKHVEDSDDLEIPETLKPVVSEKIVDCEWVSSYWLAKYRQQMMPLEEEEDEDDTSDEDEDCEGSGPRAVPARKPGRDQNIFTRIFSFIMSKIRRFFGLQ